MDQKKKPFYKQWWIWLIVVIVVIGLVGIINDDTADDSNDEVQEQEEIDTINRKREVRNISGEQEDESTEVELTLDAELNGDLIEFQGNTNLPDGALIAYEVWHEDDFERLDEGA